MLARLSLKRKIGGIRDVEASTMLENAFASDL
jgi:hypothetical protein